MLDIAVIGAGVMGAKHVRVASRLPGVQVRYVVDPDPGKGRPLAESVGAVYLEAAERWPKSPDAAIIAAPNEHHAEVSIPLLAAGIPVLIEKPIAPTPNEAKEIVSAAARSGAILMVGHVERFNPAVIEATRLVREPLHIEAQRISPYALRVQTGVVLDLMIHDLDIVTAMVRSPVERVHALGVTTRSDTEDLVTALLAFANGATATLTASRIGQQKVRRLVITQRDNVVSADLIRQDVTIHRSAEAEFVDAEGGRYRQSGVIEVPFLERRGEPLRLQHEHFLTCIEHGNAPVVSGEEALDALLLAYRVLAAAASSDG